jgi:hypothetical protein
MFCSKTVKKLPLIILKFIDSVLNPWLFGIIGLNNDGGISVLYI